MRTCYHFIDRLQNINPQDGNAWAGITNAGGDAPSGTGDALDIHSVANGGFPTLDSYSIGKFDINGGGNVYIYTNSFNDGYRRLVSKPTRDVEESFTANSGNNIYNSFGWIYAKVQDSINGAVIDVNGDVNQLARNYNDICKDRLYFSGKADLSVGLDFPNVNWSNLSYMEDETANRVVFLPFLDPITGKPKPTPQSRWSQSYGWTNTDGIIGILFSFGYSRARNGSGTRNAPYAICRVRVLFEDGKQRNIISFSKWSEPENTTDRNNVLKNKTWEFWMNSLGVFRIVKRNRFDNSIMEVIGGSNFKFNKNLFPDDTIGNGSQLNPFVFGLGYFGEIGNYMLPNHIESSQVKYTFS